MDNENPIDSPKDLLDNARGITIMPAFLEWKRQIEDQIAARQAEVFRPAHEIEGGHAAQEFMKGELTGLMHAVKHWELMIDFLQSEVQQRIEERKDE